ncbi:hypothetical protein PA01_12725 [Azoarcus sp. PA01]|nr:hypothetical protein PA01_12725 [Azoarcus sp. PA01]
MKAVMPASDMTSYCGDEYDRTGCSAVIEVVAAGYQLSIFAPNGAPMECYRAVKSSAATCRMLKEWIEGGVPRLSRSEDQRSESKS